MSYTPDAPIHRVRTMWVMVALGAILVVAGGAIALHRTSEPSTGLTPEAVTQAFASRGVALVVRPNAGLAPGLTERVEAFLWNQPLAARQGVVTVTVTKTAVEARALAQHRLAPSDRDGCGTTAAELRSWQAQNVVATLSRCDFTHGAPAHLAAAPVTAAVAAAMRDLAG